MPVTVPTPTLAQHEVPPPLPQPGNTWSAATNLVVGDNGQLRQSAQSNDISKCLSRAVRLANSNIFFIDAFPNLKTQNKWLSESLVTVLQDQAQTDLAVREVNLRAQQDNRYMSALISMVRHWYSLLLPARFLNRTRWQAGGAMPARAQSRPQGHYSCPQSVRTEYQNWGNRRRPLRWKSCSMMRYSILGGQHRSVISLMRTIRILSSYLLTELQGVANRTAPYQHPEITSCLSRFFRGRTDYAAEYPERFHRGKYGLQMPQAMVALIATAVCWLSRCAQKFTD